MKDPASFWNQRNHCAKQNRGRQHFRTKQEHARGNVGAVGISDGDNFLIVDLVMLCVAEITKSASSFVRFRKSSRSKTPSASRRKKRGIPFSKSLAAWTKQRSIRIQLVTQRDEIALVAARPVQKQKCALGFSGNEFVNEIRLRPHRSPLRKNLERNNFVAVEREHKLELDRTSRKISGQAIGDDCFAVLLGERKAARPCADISSWFRLSTS